MRRRHDLSDAAWAKLAPRLPARTAGKHRKDDRVVINAILWTLATGAPRRELPERYRPWASVATRFRRWTRAGVWHRLFQAVHQQADAAGPLAWSVHVVDGPTVRAHQQAAGATGGTRRRTRWGAAAAASPRRVTAARRAAASR